MRTSARLLCISALLLCAGTAHADAPVEQYRQFVERGAALFEDGDYAAARHAFTEAYEIHPAPALLFNIASTYRRERDYEPALEYYRMFVASAPDDAHLLQLANETIAQIADLLEERERADREEQERQRQLDEARERERQERQRRARAAELEAQQATSRRSAGDATGPRDAPNRSSGSRWKSKGRLALVAGGLLAAGGFFELYRAHDASRELDALAPGTPWGPMEQQTYEAGQRSDRRGRVLLVGSGALAVTGAILYAIGWSQQRDAPRLAVVPTDSGAALVVGSSF